MSDRSQTALVVDDEEAIRYVLSEELEDIGYECAEASDGQSALERMASETFQVVMLDMRMPGMSGLEVMKIIRTSYPDTCIIMCSALGNPEVADRDVTSLGADAFIPKPWYSEDLQTTIERAVRQRIAAGRQTESAA